MKTKGAVPGPATMQSRFAGVTEPCCMLPTGSSRRDVEGGSSMSQDERVRFWSGDNVPINVRERLVSSLTDVYIQLDNLVKFVELNHDGFR